MLAVFAQDFANNAGFSTPATAKSTFLAAPIPIFPSKTAASAYLPPEDKPEIHPRSPRISGKIIIYQYQTATAGSDAGSEASRRTGSVYSDFPQNASICRLPAVPAEGACLHRKRIAR